MSGSTSRWGRPFLFVSVLFGVVVRFAPTLLAGTPINDGGMFYMLIEDLKANHLLLPVFASYNHLSLPFAYPPLSLYLGAALSSIGIPTMEVLRWLPALAASLSIPAFYWMAAQILGSKGGAAVAAAFYALMPRMFSWYVMGGGLSRSLGLLFLILTCGAAWLMFSKPSWGHLGLTIVCGAGSVLSHPETALHTAAACLLIGLFRGRTWPGARDALLVAGGVAVLTSPWWATVIARHSIAPFLSALHTGAHAGLALLPWLSFNFAQEPFAAILTATALAGLLVQAVRGEWFLPVWTLLPFIVEPRSAPAAAAVPLAILGGVGLTEFVLPRVATLSGSNAGGRADWMVCLTESAAARTVTGALLIYALFAAFAYDLSLAGLTVPAGSRAAMTWVRQNTPAGARFLVLSGTSDPFSDATAEWFPALTDRTSINTVQGREWTLGKTFMPFLEDVSGLERCLNSGPDCLNTWTEDPGALDFDYVYIARPGSTDVVSSVALAGQLVRDMRYRLLYQAGGVAIFARR
jgi:hypothetical protein